MNKLILAVSALCLFPLPGRLAAQDDQESLTEYIELGAKTAGFVAGRRFDLVIAISDEAMKNALPGNKLEEIWNSVLNQTGAFQKNLGTKAERSGQYIVVYSLLSFEKTALTLRLVFDEERHLAGLSVRPESEFHALAYSPPAYVNSGSFTERDVTVGSGAWTLPGTLTLPRVKGRVPAVVLVHGSGPNDRDETVGPNRMFRDLAWGLASRGIAVLRYDKRTLTYGKRMAADPAGLTVREETIDDALAAARLLKGLAEIDPKYIFLLGHSLGGMLAPRMAVTYREIAGIIIMAGAVQPLEDIVLEQVTYLASLDKTVSPEERQTLEKLKLQVAAVKDPALSAAIPASDLPLGLPASYWLDLRAHPIAEDAAAVTQPVLVLQGGRDYQVTQDDFTLWKKLFSRNKAAVFKFYPDLSHLFIAGEGQPSPSDYEKKGNVQAAVVEDIAAWIKAPSP
jgi:dienelactone hydrolase